MLRLRNSHLRVLSAVCANLAAGWFVAIFATRDLLALTMDIVAVILSLYLAIKAEELLEEL